MFEQFWNICAVLGAGVILVLVSLGPAILLGRFLRANSRLPEPPDGVLVLELQRRTHVDGSCTYGGHLVLRSNSAWYVVTFDWNRTDGHERVSQDRSIDWHVPDGLRAVIRNRMKRQLQPAIHAAFERIAAFGGSGPRLADLDISGDSRFAT